MKLYHASFNAYKDSILKNGLKLPNGKSNFGMYIGEYIFLAKDPIIAESYAESVDEDIVPKEIYNSGICIFEINLPDNFILQVDANNLAKNTFMVDKKIPPECITEFNIENL